MDGVVRTRVGYSGGKKKDPTYRSIGDHSETIEIDYDPTRISYKKLLSVFWHSHNPTQRSWSQQYKSAIFYHNEEQESLAIASRNELQDSGEYSRDIVTEIAPASTFYMAEEYHQQYLEKRGMASCEIQWANL